VGVTAASRNDTFSDRHLSPVSTSASTPIDRWIVQRIQATVASGGIRCVLWDGFDVGPRHGAVATVDFNTRRALLACAWHPELYFGEMYMSGALDVSGDFVKLMEAIYRRPPPVTRFWQRWQPRNTLRQSRSNVHHHYDLGNDFYRLWLDRDLVYTCAYFASHVRGGPASGIADMSLEEAQTAKLDRVCQKLRLVPGERVIEAGCGWGALSLHMVKHYGVTVKAFNISTEQIAYARERARAEDLSDRVEFIEDDYRNVVGKYDAFVSVGMLEHVGLANFSTLGAVIDRTLTPAGRGLLHFIGRNRPMPLNPWINKRIFPGAYPPTLHEVCERVLEPVGLSVLDVENMRLHYAATLEHWRRRFEWSVDRVRDMFDESFVRAWRLYLSGSEASFSTGWLQLFQVVFARAASNAIPWTRLD
jgi:cyclopropane-fatty-acyl-phospholipid synthase